MRFIGDIAEDAEVRAIASGAITDGAPVLVNSNGTVSTVASATLTTENFIGIANAAYADGQKATVKTTGSIARNALSTPAQSASSGSHVTFEAGMSSNQGIAYDTNSNRVVIVYKDSGNSHYGTAIVGTLDGTSISFGTAVVYNSNTSNFNAVVFDPDTNKVILTYQDVSTDHTEFRVGIVSGTAISFPASETQWSNNICSNMSITYDTINDRVVVFARETNGNGVVVGGYGYGSDNTVDASAVNTFVTNITSRPTSVIFIEEASGTNRRVVTAFTDGGDSNKGKVMAGYPSGNNSYTATGSLTLFNNADTHYISMVKLPTIDQEGQFVVAYEDNGSGGIGKAKVGQFDKSDNSIGFGSEATFTSSAVAEIQAVYDTSRDLVHIAFSDAGNSEYLAIVTGTVSGNSISFGSKTVLNSVASVDIKSVYVPDGDYVVISYRDNSVDGRGKSVVYSPPSDQVNLTIGQQYFVQQNGSLGTSADSPSVIAGTALGTSDLIVKG